MRNLKRALSLALAFVMVMSLMIVGTSAKSYTDADKIDNQVAVEILGELGVMIGNDDGSFAPDRDVTRAEMAVLITRILYGNNLNVDQFKDMNTFTDVPDWAEGFVNLCASLDIIAGRGNGIFDPDATVTSAEAALMLSRALGYFKNNAEFGSDWALAAMKRATQIGIIGGDMVLQANAGLDRDDVAQMTFNTLTKAVPVQYNELLDVYYNVNQGVIYALEFNYLQTLGYTNFNLVYKSNQTVEYGRPATTWGIGSYKDAGNGTASGIEKADLTPAGGLIAENVRMLAKDEIITVNNTPTYVYTQDTDAKDVYADLGADVCTKYSWWNKDGYEWTAFINGEEQNNASVPTKNDGSQYTYTGKGSVTEIYVDDYSATVTVVEINYFLGQVSKVVDDEATIRPLSHEGKILDDRTFATTEFDKGDYVVFTVDYNSDNDFYICELMAPETVTGEVSRVEKKTDSQDSYVRLDGESTQYFYTAFPSHMVYDVSNYDDGAIDAQHPELNKEYVFFMTPAGYVLGFQPANETSSEYLYVKDSDEELQDWVAKVILPDATEPKVDLDSDLGNTKNYTMADEIKWLSAKETNIDGLIWDYSADSNGVYSLSYVPELNKDNTTVNSDLYQNELFNVSINNGEAYIQGTDDASHFIIDNSTIFVDTMNHKSYTGYNEVPDVKNAHIAYVVEDGVAEIVYIFDGNIYDENSIYFMLTDTKGESFKNDGDEYYEYFNAYVDGKKQSLNISYEAMEPYAWFDEDGDPLLVPGVLYQVVKSEEDGKYITEIRYAGPDTYDVTGVGDGSFRISTLPAPTTTTNSEKFDVNDETVFVLVEYTWYNGKMNMEISRGDLSDMFVGKDHEGYKVYADVVEQDGQTAELVYLTYRQPIFNYTVNVEVGEAAVRVIGKNIDKTFTEDGTFKVQSGTYLIVDAEANEGYKFVNGNPSDAYWVNWLAANDGDGNNGVYTIDAATELASAQVKLSADSKHVSFEDTDKTVIDVEKGTEVVLVPAKGYTIQGVASDDAKIQSAGITGTNKWKVTIPASSKDVVLKVTTVPDQYTFSVPTLTPSQGFFAVTVKDESGKELKAGTDKLIVGEKYTVSVKAAYVGTQYNGYNLEVNDQDVAKTDGGVNLVAGVLNKDSAAAALSHKVVVYSDKSCAQEYAITTYAQLQASIAAGNLTFYYVETAADYATATYTFTVHFVATGSVDFTVVQ